MGTVSIQSLNDTTTASTTGAQATVTGDSANTAVSANTNRGSLEIYVEGADAWIRLLPAATDAGVRKGSFVRSGQTWSMPNSWWRRTYTGEVSIINAVDGQSPTYYVTEI